MAIRLVLADDHRIILEGLEQLFRRNEDFEVMAACTDGEQALSSVRRYKPDVLVLDVQMPRMSGLEVMRALKQESLPTRVVLLTATLDDDGVLEAINLGASGLVLKEAASIKLVQCVREVAKGGKSLEQSLVQRALEKMMRRHKALEEVADLLSPRETEVVRMVATGLRNKEIA